MNSKRLMLIILLAFTLLLCGCGIRQNDAQSVKTPDVSSQAPKYEVSEEQAKKDLCQRLNYHPAVQNGNIRFEERRYKRVDICSDPYGVTYVFKIAVPQKYATENYRATIFYRIGDETWTVDDCEIKQIDSTFTQLGVWQYSNGDTSIWVNFISANDTEYEVEYEITFYKSGWSSGGYVTVCSNGKVKVYGDNTNDENRKTYLQIELRSLDENMNWVDAGWISVYPDSGVCWNHVNERGGQYWLEQ